MAGLTALNPANYRPFAPNGFTGIHQGAAIVFARDGLLPDPPRSR